jgi:serine/threonine protein kinase
VRLSATQAINADLTTSQGNFAIWKARERESCDVVYIKKHFRLFLEDSNPKQLYREIFYLYVRAQLQHKCGTFTVCMTVCLRFSVRHVQSLKDYVSVTPLLHVLSEPTGLDLYVVYPNIPLSKLSARSPIAELCNGVYSPHPGLLEAQLSSGHIEYVSKQLLLALSYLHTAGLCHGSLRPGTVLLTEACEVKLSDFSQCKPLGESCGDTGNLQPGWSKATWYHPPGTFHCLLQDSFYGLLGWLSVRSHSTQSRTNYRGDPTNRKGSQRRRGHVGLRCDHRYAHHSSV